MGGDGQALPQKGRLDRSVMDEEQACMKPSWRTSEHFRFKGSTSMQAVLQAGAIEASEAAAQQLDTELKPLKAFSMGMQAVAVSCICLPVSSLEAPELCSPCTAPNHESQTPDRLGLRGLRGCQGQGVPTRRSSQGPEGLQP